MNAEFVRDGSAERAEGDAQVALCYKTSFKQYIKNIKNSEAAPMKLLFVRDGRKKCWEQYQQPRLGGRRP